MNKDTFVISLRRIICILIVIYVIIFIQKYENLSHSYSILYNFVELNLHEKIYEIKNIKGLTKGGIFENSIIIFPYILIGILTGMCEKSRRNAVVASSILSTGMILYSHHENIQSSVIPALIFIMISFIISYFVFYLVNFTKDTCDNCT